MGFKRRRDKRSEAVKDGSVKDVSVKDVAEFRHSSGATNLEGLLGEHTLDAAAEAAAPKGYRARSIAKSENRR